MTKYLHKCVIAVIGSFAFLSIAGTLMFAQSTGSVPIRAHDGSLDLELIDASHNQPQDGRTAIVSFNVPVDDQTVFKFANAATNAGEGAEPAAAELKLTKKWIITLNDGNGNHAVIIKGNGRNANGKTHPVTIRLSDPRDSFNQNCPHGSYCLHDGEQPDHETFTSIHVESGGATYNFACADETKCALDVGFNPGG